MSEDTTKPQEVPSDAETPNTETAQATDVSEVSASHDVAGTTTPTTPDSTNELGVGGVRSDANTPTETLHVEGSTSPEHTAETPVESAPGGTEGRAQDVVGPIDVSTDVLPHDGHGESSQSEGASSEGGEGGGTSAAPVDVPSDVTHNATPGDVPDASLGDVPHTLPHTLPSGVSGDGPGTPLDIVRRDGDGTLQSPAVGPGRLDVDTPSPAIPQSSISDDFEAPSEPTEFPGVKVVYSGPLPSKFPAFVYDAAQFLKSLRVCWDSKKQQWLGWLGLPVDTDVGDTLPSADKMAVLSLPPGLFYGYLRNGVFTIVDATIDGIPAIRGYASRSAALAVYSQLLLTIGTVKFVFCDAIGDLEGFHSFVARVPTAQILDTPLPL